ncbi:hypothetical protein GR7B_00148 [Vibrio phage vB_VcorM_GR7B]|nr:hypothetical protein GR7B_00148 [Vibrio phage vB_VcorM_GR7B]
MPEITIYSDVNDRPLDSTQKVENIQSVYQALDHLFNTKKKERLFRENIGIDLEDLLFEPVDEITSEAIFTILIDGIAASEPRVSLNLAATKVIPDATNHRYDIEVVFTIKGFEDELSFKGEIPAATKN